MLKNLINFLLICILLPINSLMAQVYDFNLVLTGPGNGSPGSNCTAFTLALESALGVRCGDSEAIFYKNTGNVVVKRNGSASVDLTQANIALESLLSQPSVSSAVRDAIKKNVSNGIYWASESEFEKILNDTGKLTTGSAEEISSLLNKSKAVQSGSTGTYLKQEFQKKLAIVKELTSGEVDLPRARDVEVFYNKFTTGSSRFKNAINQAQTNGFASLSKVTEDVFSEISSLNPFHPDYATLQAANVWLIEQYTHDGLIVDLQNPQGNISLKTDLFSRNSSESYYASEIRRSINQLIIEGRNNPEYLQGVPLLIQADEAFSSGDDTGAQRLLDRAQNFLNYEKGLQSNLQLSLEAKKLFNLSASSSSFAGNESIQIANYIADLASNIKGEYNGVAIKFAQDTLNLATAQTNIRSANFYLESASRVIDQLEGRIPSYLNGSMASDEGHVDNNDPNTAFYQLKEIANAYRSLEMTTQADRLDNMAIVMENFNSGNSLPYQSAQVSNEAREAFGVDFKPDSFLGYASIHLVNRMVTSAGITDNAAYRNAAILIALNLMSRQNKDLKGGIRDLEQGWSLLDFAEGVTHGLFSSAKGTVEGVAQLVFHPIDTTIALGQAIYNYEETGKAIGNAIVESYETLKNCDANAKACGDLVGKIAGDIAQLYLPVGQLANGAKLAASAKIAAVAEMRLAQQIIKSGAKLGLNSGDEISKFLKRLDNLNPCNLAQTSPPRRQFDFILKALFPTAYADGNPCKGGGFSLVEKERFVGRLAANPRISPKEIDEILSTASLKQLRDINDIDALSRWSKGRHDTLADSLDYHLNKHGTEDLGKYLRQSVNFNKKGAQTTRLEDGAIRWNKGKEFLIERDGWIVSYGKNP